MMFYHSNWKISLYNKADQIPDLGPLEHNANITFQVVSYSSFERKLLS